MVRIHTKGGVWKNTEDEILKAAVMKYGLNQWARISSLLVRKSAKQCKARWYEWLDPSIKKTEWSREEEERLLHLAKLFPNQWRSIAPLVGRTAAQCLEHYEKLLDEAQDREEGYDPSDDPRKLRPGEIDPNPETKPARPDPIDMDEDEKEMLQEARARLANTKGKKAKRKAREKQLDEARRLASLQKRRELKAAGIEFGRRFRRVRGIDYNKEIPFHRHDPAGFYEAEEDEERNQKFQATLLQKLEGRRRSEEEERRRRENEKKRKKREEENLPEAIREMNKRGDVEQIRKRSKLSLPTPQISDGELEEIARFSKTSSELDDEDDGVTSTLLAKYTPTPGRTPMPGTPGRPGNSLGTTASMVRTPARPDTVMIEAQNIIALQSGNTPLQGGDNKPLNDPDFGGITPSRREFRTPNVMMTPSRTPLRTGEPGSKRRALETPLRDDMRINEFGEEEDSAFSAANAAAEKQKLFQGLSKLPKPSKNYKIVLPEMDDKVSGEDKKIEMDMEEIERLQREEEERLLQQRLAERSQVLKSNGVLPRPTVNTKLVKPAAEWDALNELQKADQLIRREIVEILHYEAIHYPIRGQASAPSADDGRERFAEDEISYARKLIAAEIEEMEKSGDIPQFDSDVFEEKWRAAHAKAIFNPTTSRVQPVAELSREEHAQCLAKRFEKLQLQMQRDSERADKLEAKVKLYNGGYLKRHAALESECEDMLRKIEAAKTEHACFEELAKMEERGAKERLEALRVEVKKQLEEEALLQKRYGALRRLAAERTEAQ